MKILTLLLLSLLVCYMGTADAQPKKRAFPVDSENAPDPRIKIQALPQTPPEDPTDDDPDAVPITGLEYLLIGGGIFGVFRKIKRKSSQEDN